jgi:DNA-binding CsgD family transcriptional regulator
VRHNGLELRGRHSEIDVLDRLLTGVRAGESRVVVLHGEAGIGKTALLDHLAQRAAGCRIARAHGVESEMELAYAGLQQLCMPLVDRVDGLPFPQRDALRIAFGLDSGGAPDRLLVGLAVHSLLAGVAAEQPLVCVLDDAQWLDRASMQALAFVARRLSSERIGLALAVREVLDELDLEGLPQLEVRGLADADARALLESAVPGALDEQVRDRIVAETRGNPLALLELPRSVTPAELAGGFGLPDTAALATRIEESFRRRLEPLPDATRLLLVVAAAEPVGDSVLVWNAATALGVDAEAATPATVDGLVEFGSTVRFHHPLVRSAVYRDAAPETRMRVHRALADATNARDDPDRRAWHLAQATVGLDEDVAGELERSADRARARGGLAAAAAFLERAAALTPTPERRAQRALAAAHAKYMAGAPDSALRLLALAQAGPLDDLQRARAELVRAQIAFVVNCGRDAPPLLLDAAKRLEPLDPALARATYLDAFFAALFAGRLAESAGVRDIAAAVLSSPVCDSSERPADLLLLGIATLTTEGHAAAAPMLRAAVNGFRDESMAEEDALRWLWLASHVARALGDDAAWDELTERLVFLSRSAGALGFLPFALTERMRAELLCGNVGRAQSLAAEADTAIEANGSMVASQGALMLAAWAGDEDETLALFDAGRQDVARRGEGMWLISAEWTRAELLNGLGRWDEALAAASWVAEHPDELGSSTWVAAELVEAAARSGNTECAGWALMRLMAMARASGTDWARGIEARTCALVSEGEAAERLYREAIERLGRTRIRFALARAHLVYGEWLRRENRRIDAREQLRAAHELLVAMGALGFAARAQRELQATGETARRRVDETRGDLTAQESEIARLAAEGYTNPEIGALLFISARTVEWHLRKVYPKLGVASRRELRRALPRNLTSV